MYEVNEERLRNTFMDLVKRPSPSWNEKAVIEYLVPVFNELGVSWSLHPCGQSNNLLARVDGDPNRKTLLFSCHMDTVVPCENVNPQIRGGKITSDGKTVLGGDDKAAIAAFIEAMRVIHETGMPHGPLEFLFSCAEEVGLYGIKGYRARCARNVSAVTSETTAIIQTAGTPKRPTPQAKYATRTAARKSAIPAMSP